MVIKNARRKGAKEENPEMGQKEKKGFVDGPWEGKTPASGICVLLPSLLFPSPLLSQFPFPRLHPNITQQVIPTTLESLMQLTINRELSAATTTCSGCTKPRPEDVKTGRCKGCESVWYCGKVSLNPSLTSPQSPFTPNTMDEHVGTRSGH